MGDTGEIVVVPILHCLNSCWEGDLLLILGVYFGGSMVYVDEIGDGTPGTAQKLLLA